MGLSIGKAWTTIDSLSTIWKSNFSDWIKQEISETVAVEVLLYGCSTRNLTKRLQKKARWELHKDAVCYFEQIRVAATYAVRSLTFHFTNHSNKMRETNHSSKTEAQLEKQGGNCKRGLFIGLHAWKNQCKPTNKAVSADLRTRQDRWKIGSDGGRESKESMLSV